MQNELDLKQIEEKAYMKYLDDGIWDLFAGMVLAGLAVGFFYHAWGIAGGLPLAAILLAPMIKKSITRPRLGYVKFSPTRERREKWNLTALAGLLTVTALAGGVVSLGWSGESEWQLWIQNLGLIPFGVVLAAIGAAVGMLYELGRYFIYAGVLLGAFIICHWLQLAAWLQFAIPGSLMTAVGIVLLARFITKYPKAVSEGTPS